MDMDDGLRDAVEAFFEAGKSGDFDEATQAFKDMWRLVDDDSENYDKDQDAKDEGRAADRGKPLNVLIGLVKKK